MLPSVVCLRPALFCSIKSTETTASLRAHKFTVNPRLVTAPTLRNPKEFHKPTEISCLVTKVALQNSPPEPVSQHSGTIKYIT